MKAHIGKAHWEGNLKEGRGEISTGSGALDKIAYGFNTRFAEEPGTNPEELLGAAHAACFTMALSKELGDAGMTANALDTTAKVRLEQTSAGFSITRIDLVLHAKIPDGDPQTFETCAERAKSNCPVSRLFNTKITLEHHLE